MKKWMRRLGYFLLFLFVLLNIICASQAYKLTHVYDAPAHSINEAKTPDFLGNIKAVVFGADAYKNPVTQQPLLPYSDIVLETADGQQLKGWSIPNRPSKGTVILFHGHGGNRENVLNEANEFFKMGYSVVMTDFRAHGSSSGNASAIGYTEWQDVQSVYHYVTRQGEKNIILYGISLGAAAISKAIYEDTAIHPSKVILEMPFATLHDAVIGRLKLMQLPSEPFGTLLTFWGGIEQGFWAFNNRPAEYVKALKMPVLLQWGRNDVRVAETETRLVFENMGTKNKKLVVYEESGHQSLCNNENEKWLQNVEAFLQQ